MDVGTSSLANRWLPLVLHCRVASGHERQELLSELSNLSGCRSLAFANAHAFNLCWSDRKVRDAFLDADFLLRDGIGVKLLLRALGRDAGDNMVGTDFIPTLLAELASEPIGLIGSTDENVSRAGNELLRRGNHVVLMANGFLEFPEYLRRIDESQPRVLVLGMGMPKQETFAAYAKRHLTRSCLIVCGGAILDYTAGAVPRAPAVLRRYGMEWLYRLCLEPRRLARRYVVGNVLFLARLAITTAKLRSLRQSGER